MSDADDSEDENVTEIEEPTDEENLNELTGTNKLASITTSFHNLSISSNDKDKNKNDKNDDGFKILFEASQRKLRSQEKKVTELTTSYEALKKECDNAQKSERAS